MAKQLHPVEAELAARESLIALSAMNRDAVIHTAATTCNVAWIRKAHRARRLEALVLGRFDLIDPAGNDPRPSVMVTVKTANHDGAITNACLLALYLGPDNTWEVNDRPARKGPDGNWHLNVPWSQYRGRTSGPPSVINGDWAGGPRPGAETPPEVTPGRLVEAAGLAGPKKNRLRAAWDALRGR